MWAATLILSHISHHDDTTFKFLSEILENSQISNFRLGTISTTLAISQYPNFNSDKLVEKLRQNPTDLPLLRALKTCLEFGGHAEIFDILKNNLSNHNYVVRLITLQILQKCENSEILQNLVEAENCEISLPAYRTRLNILRKIETALEGQSSKIAYPSVSLKT